jgi:hypothetical protein
MKLDVIRVRVLPSDEQLTIILRARDQKPGLSRGLLIAAGVSCLIASLFLAAVLWKCFQ